MAICKCKNPECGREFESPYEKRFCSQHCKQVYARARKAKRLELIAKGLTDAEARAQLGMRPYIVKKEVNTKLLEKEQREARARRLAERDAAYAREFPDCVAGEWRGQRRIGMFSGLRKAVEG